MQEIIRYESPAAFDAAVREHLVEDEAMNNHMFDVIASAIAGAYPRENVWLAALDAGRVRGCALRVSPWPLAVSYGAEPGLARLLAAAACEVFADSFDVNVSPHLLPAVADGFGRKLEEVLAQGVYQVEVVRPPVNVPGRVRPAVEWDVDLVALWTADFHAQGEGPSLSESEARQMARRLVVSGGLVIWEVESEPVSMACSRGPTPSGIRISLVYTPPEQRRRGYAAACVAALSQREIDRGRQRCFLFTDLANLTSNHVYQSIGFERVGELGRYRPL